MKNHHWPSTILSVAVMAFFGALIALNKVTWLEASPGLLALVGIFYKPKTRYGEIDSVRQGETIFPTPDVPPPPPPAPPDPKPNKKG